MRLNVGNVGRYWPRYPKRIPVDGKLIRTAGISHDYVIYLQHVDGTCIMVIWGYPELPRLFSLSPWTKKRKIKRKTANNQ